ncbi:hypothetical protein [Archangium lansingense]|uniref:DUF4190 domain-containing protein n=1 Tax=Archangium lansingense TaxID=2995310 RepID=A0ABT4ARW6_9BACT|nr:hypothetical protein [Archangium lansinium]MCY1083557.1 hypothetical protein [Archangium lansinium]
MSAPATSTALQETPCCAHHPGQEAVGTCARCGAFYCEAESIRHGEHTYCESCGGRPEVGHLERLRQELWGKRDGWAWLMLASAPLHLVFTVGMGMDGLWHWSVLGAANTAVVVAWFLGVPLARPALLLLPPLWLVGFTLKGRDLGVLALLAPAMGLALWLYASTRVRLFFRQEVDLERLERLWDARENNPLARHALVCGLAGLVVPVAAPLAMGLGVAGLRRVNLEATPPIGKRQQALAGLVLGGLGLVGWTGFVLWRLSQGLPLLP